METVNSEDIISIERMVKIPAGDFLMGSEDWGPFEGPVHNVYINEFWIDINPITNFEYSKFVDETGYKTTAEEKGGAYGYLDGEYREFIDGLSWKSYFIQERGNHPVVLVSWFDANEYAKWCGKRLPTEAEWERVARGNLNQNLFPWGNSKPNTDICNFAKPPANMPPTSSSGSFQPSNDFGVNDIVGNVWQWCDDWFEENYYAHSPKENPKGPLQGKTKVRRGGAWNVIQDFRLRCSNRGALLPNTCMPNIGFRCAYNF